MMNKFLKKQCLALILLMSALMAPIAFAQGQVELGAPAQASAQDREGRQKLFQASPFIRTELYFGRNKPDGAEVSRKEFDKFLSGFVTERFPDGLTVDREGGVWVALFGGGLLIGNQLFDLL